MTSPLLNRRNALIGVSCLAAAGAAKALTPRRSMALITHGQIEAGIPNSLPGWSADAAEGLVKPKVEGLAATIYDDVIQRTYRSAANGAEVMLLVAYGGTQSEFLQLHRPETCYSALGFDIKSKSATDIPLLGDVAIPAVEIVAVAGERWENILYWTRIGSDFPRSARSQRQAVFGSALKGVIPDGVLARVSLVSQDSRGAQEILREFVPALLRGASDAGRVGLVGADLAKQVHQAIA